MQSRELSVEGWEKVVHFTDDEAGLSAIICVHDATLGPGCGGCRIFPYADFDAGLEDVKRLSRGMTYKNAVGGIPFGGGKAVIFADPKKDKTPAMIKAFAKAVDSLDGKYYTAEDSGVTEDDIALMQTVTAYAAGIGKNGIGGNPSPFTARGVWRGLQAAARHHYGTASLEGLRVAILGVGAVGMELARLVHAEGASLVVADVYEPSLEKAKREFDAEVMSPDDIIAADVDIFSPCALGGSINEGTIDRLRAKIVAGAANNQLKTPNMDQALADRGVLYAPDYVINAMGVISVGLEIRGEWTEDEIIRRTDAIGDQLSEIFTRAEKNNVPTGAVADELALEIIESGRENA